MVLFGELYKERVMTSHDVTLIGEDLARRFCEGGCSFALYKLFDVAGHRVCYGRTHERAKVVVKTAFEEIRVSRSHDPEVHTCFAVSSSFRKAIRKCTEVELTSKALKAMITSYIVINSYY